MRKIQGDEQKVLSNFFGAYFHQDWICDSGTPAAVVALYMRDAKTDQIDCLKTGILHLIDSDCDNVELEARLFHDFYCFYRPSGVGLDVREWLQSIVTILSAKP